MSSAPSKPGTAEFVKSKDGTSIAYWRSGDGPPLVLVHGGPADHHGFASLTPLLESHFTVYAMDRRGRSPSGDATDYALEREFEDVAAVADRVGGPLTLFGHSFGGVCALEASVLSKEIARLILYEAWLTEFIPRTPGVLDKIEQLAAEGDNEGVLLTILRDDVHMPEEEIDRMQSLPSWAPRVEAAGKDPREERALDNYRFDPGRFRHVQIPALVITGSKSPKEVKASGIAIQSALRNCRLVYLEGEQHAAHHMNPQLLADEIVRFAKQT